MSTYSTLMDTHGTPVSTYTTTTPYNIHRGYMGTHKDPYVYYKYYRSSWILMYTISTIDPLGSVCIL